jgi:hypothetical protein
LEFYLGAAGDGGTVVTDPPAAPLELHVAKAIHTEALFVDDFENDLGWQVQGGDNTNGRWARVIPVGTTAQPHFDRSPDSGRFCFVTGQHFEGSAGTNDVDEGPVVLISPIIPIPAHAEDVEIGYARWFHWNGEGNEDFLKVGLSRDGGSSWVPAETVVTTGGWAFHTLRLSEFPGATGDQLRIRFSAEDSPNDSLTEAAIDEVRIHATYCSLTHGDADHDGVIDLADAIRMSACWSGPDRQRSGDACGTFDFDRDFRVDLADYKAFQVAFSPR